MNDLTGLSKLYVQGGQSIAVEIGATGGTQPPASLHLTAELDQPEFLGSYTETTLLSTILRSNRRVVLNTLDTGTEARVDTVVTFTLRDGQGNQNQFTWMLQVYRTCAVHRTLILVVLNALQLRSSSIQPSSVSNG